MELARKVRPSPLMGTLNSNSFTKLKKTDSEQNLLFFLCWKFCSLYILLVSECFLAYWIVKLNANIFTLTEYFIEILRIMKRNMLAIITLE